MDLTSDFYRDPKTGQPIRFKIGAGYNFEETNIRISYIEEIWNITKDQIVKTEKQMYVDPLDRRIAWFNTPLSLMQEKGYGTFGEVFTGEVLETILSRYNIDPINDKI